MHPESVTADSEVAIFGRLIEVEKDDMTPDVAGYILRIEFPQADRDRMNALAVKARAGTLTPAEDEALENYLRVGHLLSLMKSKARKVLKNNRNGT
jgi:hypothetical protein